VLQSNLNRHQSEVPNHDDFRDPRSYVGHIIGDEVAAFEFASREEAESFIEDERFDPKTFVVDEAEADHRLH